MGNLKNYTYYWFFINAFIFSEHIKAWTGRIYTHFGTAVVSIDRRKMRLGRKWRIFLLCTISFSPRINKIWAGVGVEVGEKQPLLLMGKKLKRLWEQTLLKCQGIWSQSLPCRAGLGAFLFFLMNNKKALLELDPVKKLWKKKVTRMIPQALLLRVVATGNISQKHVMQKPEVKVQTTRKSCFSLFFIF